MVNSPFSFTLLHTPQYNVFQKYIQKINDNSVLKTIYMHNLQESGIHGLIFYLRRPYMMLDYIPSPVRINLLEKAEQLYLALLSLTSIQTTSEYKKRFPRNLSDFLNLPSFNTTDFVNFLLWLHVINLTIEYDRTSIKGSIKYIFGSIHIPCILYDLIMIHIQHMAESYPLPCLPIIEDNQTYFDYLPDEFSPALYVYFHCTLNFSQY